MRKKEYNYFGTAFFIIVVALILVVTVFYFTEGRLLYLSYSKQHNNNNRFNFDLRKDLFKQSSLRKTFSALTKSTSKTTIESLQIQGIRDGIAASINGCVLKTSKSMPIVGGKPHFEGMLSINNNGKTPKKLILHLSTPGKDPHWYITIDDIVKYDNNGNNITPIIAFTIPELKGSVPWKHHVAWNVHDSRTNGWKRYETLVFKPIELKRVNDADVVSLKKNINELEIDLKHLLLT
jgi:hypothetical protein